MAVFWPGRKKENCGRGDWGGDRRYDVKMPNGENYVWVRKQKKLRWFFCGATGLPLCWWSQRAPYGPIIIWTLGAGGSECEREKSYVCVDEYTDNVGPNVYKSISVDTKCQMDFEARHLKIDRESDGHHTISCSGEERDKRLQWTWWKIIYKHVKKSFTMSAGVAHVIISGVRWRLAEKIDTRKTCWNQFNRNKTLNWCSFTMWCSPFIPVMGQSGMVIKIKRLLKNTKLFYDKQKNNIWLQ